LICPNDQFMPKPPDPEDIIFDDNSLTTTNTESSEPVEKSD